MASSEWIVESDRPGREQADHRDGAPDTSPEDWLPQAAVSGPTTSFAERARRVEAQLRGVERQLDEAVDRTERAQSPRS